MPEGWDSLDTLKFTNEGEAIRRLMAKPPLSPEARAAVAGEAAKLVERARKTRESKGLSRASSRNSNRPRAKAWP